MDPISIYQMGQVRQQEILEWAEKNRGGKPLRQYVSEVGSLLIRVGRKLVNAANPALEGQTVAPHTSVEIC
jgi:hypothetical protein